MIQLFHYPLSVTSRFARLVLAECEVTPELVEERFWERREDFVIMNPAATLPVLVENDGPPICGALPAPPALACCVFSSSDDIALACLLVVARRASDAAATAG